MSAATDTVTSPTWYDLLGVAPSATAAEVRAAWRTAIADLDPADRRFETLNRAAKVLLDPSARAAYDASLEGEDVPERDTREIRETDARETGPRETDAGETDAGETREPAPSGRPRVPTWLLAGLGVLATVLAGTTALTWPGGEEATEAAREAQVAAERAVVPVLSYDHRDLEGSAQAARARLTGSYRDEYDSLFAVLEENAPRTRTTVEAEVVASGIVRGDDDRVQVLLFVDRPTTNKESSAPVVYRDQVTLSMQRVDGEWLVDDMVTTPPAQ